MTKRIPLNLKDPKDNLYAFGKLWGYYGDEPVIGYFHGTVFGLVGNEVLKPLFGYVGTGVTKMRILEDGSLQMRGKETNFITDLQTGKVLNEWKNPYTDEVVEPFHFIHDEIGAIMGTEMERIKVGDSDEATSLPNEATATKMGEQESYPFVMPWTIYGDEVLLDWDYMHAYKNPVTKDKWPKAHATEINNPSEHFTIYTSLSELEDRDLPSANYRGSFSRIAPWFPWMRMGGSGIEGYVLGRHFSRKITTLDHMDKPLREYIEKHHADSLLPPDDWDIFPLKGSQEGFVDNVPPEVRR